ncbi:hypothetical protein [Pseudoflavonifractor sp. An44]|uniref:hypothetical protein n=1 Tax=Pseudoflavonifractor sp. An44 TaxID=1965635 RepID=UPI00117A62FB|nr:hypothetical protein [Pseudoflavonifractor sp. An44]
MKNEGVPLGRHDSKEKPAHLRRFFALKSVLLKAAHHTSSLFTITYSLAAKRLLFGSRLAALPLH